MGISELSDGGPQGARFGKDATELISFFGATPVAQPSGSTQAAVATTALTTMATTAATSTTPFGFTEAQANAIIAAVNGHALGGHSAIVLVNKIRADLVTLGLIAGA